MKVIAEIEACGEAAVRAALAPTGLRLLSLREIAPINFGATKPCQHRDKIASCTTDWAGADTQICMSCGTPLNREGLGSRYLSHPGEGEVPDYGQPEPVPAGTNLVRYNEMECDCGRLFLGAFYLDGRLTEVREITGSYHKNGKWSYSDLSVVVPAKCVLLCAARSTHSAENNRRYLQWQDKKASIGKLTELDRLPDAARISQQLGVEITPEVLDRIALYRTLFPARQRWNELKELEGIPTY